MEFDLVIKGGQVIDPIGGVSAANVGITAGRVAALLAPEIPVRAREAIDARGRYLFFPGVIEPHAHHRGRVVARDHAVVGKPGEGRFIAR